MAKAAGHADRNVPLKNYCTGLLLPGDRKSVEPMAARLAPDNVRRMHQSLHHVVADAPWNDEAVLDSALDFVLPAMLRQGPVVAWVVDDTGFPKKGKESVGVARQYCGQVGKQDNCRVAVSLSVTTDSASMPVAYRLYLPEVWIKDEERRKKTGVPEEIQFQTKPELALEQIQRARQRGIPQGVVLADAGYGNDTGFRLALTEMEMQYVMGVQSTVTVWKPEEEPKPAPPYQGMGRPPKLLRRDRKHQPISAKDLALSLPADSWKKVNWRQGVNKKLQSRFAAVRVRPAHRDYWQAEPHPAEWLLMEWPTGESEPTKYWLSTLPENASLKGLVRLAKHRWIIERDYEELKQELGLGHYEGRGWRGFHHHATLCIAAYGFLVAERNRFSPSARIGHLGLPAPQLPPDFQPRGSRPAGTA
ncbi:MAG TPA: IS701 family transposase [Bryobacteraceae bacterium]|nr:IS701 family transposase [Bryobacteraceae bacterium]